jgi:hypothetical protein
MSFQRTASARLEQGSVWIAPPLGQFEKWRVFVLVAADGKDHLCRVVHVPKAIEADPGYQEHLATYTVEQLRQAGATAVIAEDTMRVQSTLEAMSGLRRGLEHWREEVAPCLPQAERDTYEAMMRREFADLCDRFYPTTETLP